MSNKTLIGVHVQSGWTDPFGKQINSTLLWDIAEGQSKSRLVLSASSAKKIEQLFQRDLVLHSRRSQFDCWCYRIGLHSYFSPYLDGLKPFYQVVITRLSLFARLWIAVTRRKLNYRLIKFLAMMLTVRVISIILWL